MVRIYTEGLFYMSVCTDEEPEQMLATVRALSPAGTTNNWRVADEPFASGAPNPSPCSGHGSCEPETHKHYLLAC